MTYGTFCPVAKAAEVLCERWTVLVVRELLCGSSRFSDLQRGLPGCPPATLSKRLRQLAAAGVVERRGQGWALTPAGGELYPLVEGLGRWGQRWARSRYGPDELDADLLLWDLRRFLDPAGLGEPTAVVELQLSPRRYWLVADRGAVDVCLVDPERDVDVLVQTDLRTMTRIWMGDTSWSAAVHAGELSVSGAPALAARVPGWISTHPVLAAVPAAR